MDCTNRYSDLNNGFTFESYFYSKLKRFRDYSANISSLGNVEIWARDVYVKKINILKGFMAVFNAQGRQGALLEMDYGKLHSFLWKIGINIIHRFSIT